jgi:hypothetical protein
MLPQRRRRELVDEDDAAAYLKISVRSLQKRRVHGEPPRFVKLGHRVLYDLDVLDAWISECERGSTSEVQP